MDGLEPLMAGVAKPKRVLEQKEELNFHSREIACIYTTLYVQRRPRYFYEQQRYDTYHKVIQDYLNETAVPSLRNQEGECLLREIVKKWDNHKTMVKWLYHFFNFLETNFIRRKGLPSLWDSGLACFCNLVIQPIHSKVKDLLLELIHKEREGEWVDRALLKDIINVFVENPMGTYEEYCESFVLEDTTLYYSPKASKWIEDNSCPQYMVKYEECIRREKERLISYLHVTTEPKIVERIQHAMLTVVSKQLIEKEHTGCVALLRDGKMEDVVRMYKLYHPIPQGLEPIAQSFKQYITEEGYAIIEAHAKHVNQVLFIRKVIELHDKNIVYVSDYFQNHNLFHKALREAFEIICNQNVAGLTVAEILATVCDDILTKGGGSKKLSDEATEDMIEKVAKLVVYISHKELFAEFYWNKLARRLLFDRSDSEHHERSMLAKLKRLVRWRFTSKMEGMLNDMTVSKDNQKDLVEYLRTEATANSNIDLSVTALTSGYWPSYKTPGFNLPTELVNCVNDFKGFYTRNNAKNLSWVHSIGTCTIVGDFDEKPIELVVSTYQAAVLVLFNNTTRLSYTEIVEQVGLSHEDLARQLHSLSCSKYKVLIKEPDSETISRTDSFEFNSKFTNKKKRIKVFVPLLEERNTVFGTLNRNIRLATEALLIKIVKRRRVVGRQELVSTCVDYLSPMFKVDIGMIETRIEDLISRNHMQRDKDNEIKLNHKEIVVDSRGATAKSVAPPQPPSPVREGSEEGSSPSGSVYASDNVAPPQPPSPVREGSEEGSSPSGSVYASDNVAPPQPPSPVREGSEEGSSPSAGHASYSTAGNSSDSTAAREEPESKNQFVLLVGLIGIIVGYIYIMKRV